MINTKALSCCILDIRNLYFCRNQASRRALSPLSTRTVTFETELPELKGSQEDKVASGYEYIYSGYKRFFEQSRQIERTMSCNATPTEVTFSHASSFTTGKRHHGPSLLPCESLVPFMYLLYRQPCKSARLTRVQKLKKVYYQFNSNFTSFENGFMFLLHQFCSLFYASTMCH